MVFVVDVLWLVVPVFAVTVLVVVEPDAPLLEDMLLTGQAVLVSRILADLSLYETYIELVFIQIL